jgi:hypothetical protein
MIIRLHMDVLESENPVVEAKAQEARLQNLKDLCESYGYPTANILGDGSGVELSPDKLVCDFSLSKAQKENEIQQAVGGLALELMALERYWNRPRPYALLERELETDDSTPWEMLNHMP